VEGFTWVRIRREPVDLRTHQGVLNRLTIDP
jgi:hypothetical protein